MLFDNIFSTPGCVHIINKKWTRHAAIGPPGYDPDAGPVPPAGETAAFQGSGLPFPTPAKIKSFGPEKCVSKTE